MEKTFTIKYRKNKKESVALSALVAGMIELSGDKYKFCSDDTLSGGQVGIDCVLVTNTTEAGIYLNKVESGIVRLMHGRSVLVLIGLAYSVTKSLADNFDSETLFQPKEITDSSDMFYLVTPGENINSTILYDNVFLSGVVMMLSKLDEYLYKYEVAKRAHEQEIARLSMEAIKESIVKVPGNGTFYGLIAREKLGPNDRELVTKIIKEAGAGAILVYLDSDSVPCAVVMSNGLKMLEKRSALITELVKAADQCKRQDTINSTLRDKAIIMAMYRETVKFLES